MSAAKKAADVIALDSVPHLRSWAIMRRNLEWFAIEERIPQAPFLAVYVTITRGYDTPEEACQGLKQYLAEERKEGRL